MNKSHLKWSLVSYNEPLRVTAAQIFIVQYLLSNIHKSRFSFRQFFFYRKSMHRSSTSSALYRKIFSRKNRRGKKIGWNKIIAGRCITGVRLFAWCMQVINKGIIQGRFSPWRRVSQRRKCSLSLASLFGSLFMRNKEDSETYQYHVFQDCARAPSAIKFRLNFHISLSPTYRTTHRCIRQSCHANIP